MENQQTNTQPTTYDSRLEFINTVNTIVSVAESWIKEQTGINIRLLVLGEVPPQERDALGMAQVIANSLGMTIKDYGIQSRKQKYVHLRHLASHFIRHYYPDMSLNQIKRIVGHGDHSTVSNSIAMTTRLLSTNDSIFQPKYEQTLQAVTQWIRE